MNIDLYLVINVLVIVFYLLTIISAYKHGFVYEILRLISSVLSLFIAAFSASPLANRFPLLSKGLYNNPIYQNMLPLINIILWFFLITLIIKLFISLLLPLSRKLKGIPVIGLMNRFLGIIFGFLNASIWMILLASFLTLPVIPNGNDLKNNSLLAPVSDLGDRSLKLLLNYLNVDEISSEVKDAHIEFNNWLNEIEINENTFKFPE